MNVVMVIDSFYPDTLGGAEIFAFEIARRLAIRGHEICVITKRHPTSFQLREWGYSIGELPEYEEVDGVKIYRVKYLHSKILGVPSFIINSSRKLKEFPYVDLVHAHLTVSSGMAAAFYKHFHECLLLITEQGFYKSELRYFGPFFKAALRSSDHIHVVSHDLERKMSLLGIQKEKITMIPNGVDISKFKPSTEFRKQIRNELNIDDEPLVLNVSRLVAKNDILTTIRGFKLALDEAPNSKLLIIGEGPENEKLIKEAKSLDLADSIIFLGYKPNSLIPRYYSAADIFIRTPIDEGFGIVFIEAMAAGLPTIGTNVGGITDIITSGKDGMLVEIGDIQAIGRVITRMIKDRDFSRRIGEAGRIGVERRFSWEAITERVEKMYLNMIDKVQKPCS